MKISNITFGQKIPIITCSLVNRNTNETIEATIYELNAKGHEDKRYFEKLPQEWEFRPDLIDDVELKLLYPKLFSHIHFYVAEDAKEHTIGVAEISENKEKEECNLEYLETHQGRIKYTGITLLSTIAKELLKKGFSKFCIPDPYNSARKFYIDHCGFSEIKNSVKLEMDKEKLEELTHKSSQAIDNL